MTVNAVDICINLLGYGTAHRCEHKSDQTATITCGEGSENARIISAIARRICMELRTISG